MRTWVVYGKKRSQTPHVNVALVIIVLILRIYAKSLLPVYFSPLLRRSLKRCAPAEPPSPRLQCPLVGELSAPALQHLEDWEKPQILSTAFIPGTALLQVGKIHLDYCQSVCRGGKKEVYKSQVWKTFSWFSFTQLDFFFHMEFRSLAGFSDPLMKMIALKRRRMK